MASVLAAVTRPAATFWIWRTWVPLPTETVPTTLAPVPAKVKPDISPTLVPASCFSAVVAFEPRATELACVALALCPSAIAPAALATVAVPAL